MPHEQSPLFMPVRIGLLVLPGRLIKTATAETLATDEGFVTPELVRFYELLARGETPLIITGNIYVSHDGKSTPRQVGVDTDDKIAGLATLVAAVHAYGSKLVAQLNHCGRQVVPRFAGLSEAVSASSKTELVTGTRPRALAVAEIERIVARYADAAERCKRAGFDGVQIHAAHGYLLSQFLTPYTNRRTDAYGGGVEQRARVLREVLRAIKGRVGAGYPVIVKLNGSDYLPLRPGLGPRELAEIAAMLEREGADAIELSVGHYESGFPMVRGTFGRCLRNMAQGNARYLPFFRRWAFRIFRPVMALALNVLFSAREGFNLHYASEFKRKVTIPVICVGGFRTRAAMEAAIRDGHCDVVSAGRPFIADPFLYRHIRDGEPGPRCVDCNACIGHVGAQPVECYHPAVRAEKDAMLARLA